MRQTGERGIGLIHVIVGIVWIAIITIYVLILFFPVSIPISSYPSGAEVFVSTQKVGETPMKLHPKPPEGTWITVFKVEYLPYCVEFDRELRSIYANLVSAEHYKTIEVGVSLEHIVYINFSPDSGDMKKLTLDKYNGFFQLLAEELTKSEEDLKQFLMNCYADKQIVIRHIK